MLDTFGTHYTIAMETGARDRVESAAIPNNAHYQASAEGKDQ